MPLYETAIEQLSTQTDRTGKVTRPKILASTATVRRAAEQVRALMGRPEVRAFPPQGPDPGETFFARVDRQATVAYISGSPRPAVRSARRSPESTKR